MARTVQRGISGDVAGRKKHPDQYRDLVVRVAGYSAFFTALSPDTQDDIIARAEHEL